MASLRYSREPFGYLVSFPDGSLDLYNDGAESLFLTASERQELEPYRLETLGVPSDFHLNSPLIVWFEVTRKCNLLCTHCYIDAGRPRANELSFEEVIEVLDDLKRLGVFSLVLAGGEPL